MWFPLWIGTHGSHILNLGIKGIFPVQMMLLTFRFSEGIGSCLHTGRSYSLHQETTLKMALSFREGTCFVFFVVVHPTRGLIGKADWLLIQIWEAVLLRVKSHCY